MASKCKLFVNSLKVIDVAYTAELVMQYYD